MRKKNGDIDFPKKMMMIHSHELRVAEILITLGDDVDFLPTGIHYTADIRFRGLEWEIKSPIGSSARTIENNLRSALKQSQNIIIDLVRIKQPERKCLHEIRKQVKLIRSIKRIIVITKSGEIVEMSC